MLALKDRTPSIPGVLDSLKNLKSVPTGPAALRCDLRNWIEESILFNALDSDVERWPEARLAFRWWLLFQKLPHQILHFSGISCLRLILTVAACMVGSPQGLPQNTSVWAER